MKTITSGPHRAGSLLLRFLFYTVVSLFGLLSLCGLQAFAQDPPDYAMGMNPNATYHSANIDSVNMSNVRLNVHIPLLVDHSQRGKLNFSYSLSFSSSSWYGLCSSGMYVTCWWKPALPANEFIPMGLVFAMDGRLTFGGECYEDPGTGNNYCADEALEPNGAVHHLGTTNADSYGDPLNEESVDGSGIKLNFNSDYTVTLINKDGVLFLPNSGNAIEDPNGNVLTFSTSGQTTTMTDTLGRPWATTTGTTNTANCPVTATTATVWDTPGPNGTTREFKLCYSSHTISTNLPSLSGSGTTYQYTNTVSLMTGVVLPDLTTWRFDYDSYGDVANIYLPTGGTISYTYNLNPWAGTSRYRVVASRIVGDGTGYSTWNYSTPTSYPNVVTDPLGNQTAFTPDADGGLVTQIQTYSGSSTLLQTVAKAYQGLYDPYVGDLHQGSSDIGLLQSTTTTWQNGQTNKVQQTYDPGFSYTDENPTGRCGTSGVCSSVYGLVTAEAHSDYGSSSPGSTIFTTNTSYLALSVANYLWANILTPPISQTVTDASSNLCAETDYGYDNPSYIDGSGVTMQHPGAPTAGVLGNVYAIARRLFNSPCQSANPSSTLVYTYNHVYDTGMLHTSTDPRSNTTTTLYSSSYYGAYPTTVTNAAGQSDVYTYDFNTGLMTSMTDPNSEQTTYSWDCMLRPAATVYPDTGEETLTYLYGGSSGCGSGNPFNGSTYTKKITSSLNYVKTSLTDGLGRVIRTELTSDPEGTDYTDTSYDGDGRTSSVSNPCRSTPATGCGYVGYSYDGLNRVTLVTDQDGSTVSTAYADDSSHHTYCTTVTDEANRARKSCADGAGRMTGVWEDPSTGGLNYETDYAYNALGDLTAVNQGGSRSRSFSYDSLSRLLSATNPESGTIGYGYDANGNVTSRTGPKQNQTSSSTVTTTYSIDSLNRVTGKSYNDGLTPSVSLVYDQTSYWGSTILNSIGRLTAAQTPNVASELFSYDPMGRPVWQFQQTPLDYNGYFFVTMYSYNLAGGITEHDDGLGDVFYQSFDGAGRVFQVGSNQSDSQHPNPLATTNSSNGFWPAGQIRQMLLGNGLTETAAYNNRLQPCRMNVNSSGTAYSLCTDSVPSNNIQDFSYGYNVGVSDNGNVAFWSATGAQSFSRNYAYDNVNRLLAFSASSDPTGCTGLSWTDDQWGNRTNQTVTGGTCGGFSQTVNSNNRFNSSPYQYDAAGNMTADGSHHYFYDAENRLIQVDGTLGTCSSATACYLYDYSGHRVQRILSGGTPANYLYDLDGRVNSEIDLAQGSFDNSNHKLGWVASYIYLDGSLLAEYANSTTYFAHKDRLGSTRLMTDVSGCVVQNLDYLPYGESYSYTPSCTAATTALKFTGKERDSESGLDNFGARYNTTAQGRFMSPDWSEWSDPVPYADLNDPQTMNLYSYVRNNPLRFGDPDGHDHCDGPTVATNPTLCESNGGTWYPGNEGGTTLPPAPPPDSVPGDQLNSFALGVFSQLNQMPIQTFIGDIYGGSVLLGATGGTVCYYLCPEAATVSLAGETGTDLIKGTSTLNKIIGAEQRELLSDFFKTGERPEGLSDRTLKIYKDIAQRAIDAGKDGLKVQQGRVDMIINALK
jgi:RHS repeat-associated protein